MPEPLARQHGTPFTQASAGRHTILYIGSPASNVASMRDIVGRDDIHLIAAPTGEQGIQLARFCRPELIVLELGLPEVSGAEVITLLWVSKETYRIPILGLSSADCDNVPGLSMYCRRPIDVPQLRAMLHALLGPPRSARPRPPVPGPERVTRG
jgi:DNA-binding response OmpR family regulator